MNQKEAKERRTRKEHFINRRHDMEIKQGAKQEKSSSNSDGKLEQTLRSQS